MVGFAKGRGIRLDRPFSSPPTTTSLPRVRAARVWDTLSHVQSHLEKVLCQEAERLGYSLEAGRIWGPLEGHLEATISVCPLHGLVPHLEGHLQGLLWAWGPDQHCLHSAPFCPSALKAVAEVVQGHRFPVGKCGGQMGKEAKWGGVAPMEGCASVVLKGIQEIIIIFDR